MGFTAQLVSDTPRFRTAESLPAFVELIMHVAFTNEVCGSANKAAEAYT